MRVRVPLFEFMPYGAPELIESGPIHLARAVMTGAIGWAVAFALLALSGGFEDATTPKVLRSAIQLDPMPAPPLLISVRSKGPASKVAPPEARPDPVREPPAQPGVRSEAGEGGVVAPVAPATGVIPAVDRAYEVHEVDQEPQILVGPQPVYPPFAREAQVEGLVVVRARVGRDGRVEEVGIVRSIPLLDASAIEAVGRWTFHPARVEGRPVAVWILIPFRFRLH